MALGFGLKLAPQNTSIEELTAIWRLADAAGADHVWNFDHFAPMNAAPDADLFEGWTLLGAMAVTTTRVRIGCLVTGNVFRHPATLAKMATTVDHLSKGRLNLGIGAGRAEAEQETLGLSYPPAGERIAALEESLEVMKALWTTDHVDHDGPRYVLRDATSNPKPLQSPHPPLWIGGMGERATLRVVARHADVWNLARDDVELGAHLSGVLDTHCEAIGRDAGEIVRSVQLALPASPTEALDRIGPYLDAGFREFVFQLGSSPSEQAASAGELIGHLRDELGND